MPIYLLIPEDVSATDVKKPAIVACHGHGYGSREICGMEPDGSPRAGEPGLHKDFAVALVKRGYVVAAPELLGFGDRRLEEDQEAPPGASSCTKIAAHLLMAGKTLAGHRVYETVRVLDYVSSRPEVDPERIGSMGISGGDWLQPSQPHWTNDAKRSWSAVMQAHSMEAFLIGIIVSTIISRNFAGNRAARYHRPDCSATSFSRLEVKILYFRFIRHGKPTNA